MSAISNLVEFFFGKEMSKISKTQENLVKFTNSVQNFWPAKKFYINNSITIKIINGFRCVVFAPLKADKSIKPHKIIYLHGGAFVMEITSFHWEQINEIANKTNSIVYVPIYPLSNNFYSSQEDCIKMFVDLYKILLKEDSDSEYQLMGDSAGGFFALILAGQVNKLNLKKFENLFLNSPLISFDENEKPDNVKDPVLNYQLAMIIKQWQTSIQTPENAELFNVYANDFSPSEKIYIFNGEREYLLKQTKVLTTYLEKVGITYSAFVEPNMFHDYIIFTFLKQSRKGNQFIIDILNGVDQNKKTKKPVKKERVKKSSPKQKVKKTKQTE